MIVAIATAFVPWLKPDNKRELLFLGLLWLGLTLAFEFLLGKLVLNLTWERIRSDYNLLRGGLLPIGMLVLTLSPLIAARLRPPEKR